MRFFFLFLLTLTSMGVIRAHDPNLATYRIHEEHGRWLLRIDLAASSLMFLPQGLLPSNDNFNAEFAAYLKQNVSLVANAEQEVSLGHGGIKLGGHAVEAVFILNDYDPNWLTLDARITCFSENEKQQHLLRVEGASHTSKAFLNDSNAYTTRFENTRINWD